MPRRRETHERSRGLRHGRSVMRSCSWVLVCGMATVLVVSAGAAASETHVVSGTVHGSCAPTDDGLGPCCFPSEGVASSDGCGTSDRAFALWRDYCQDQSCQHSGACRGPVMQMPRVQPRALLNPINPNRMACRVRTRRTPVDWLRDVLGWPAPSCTSCGSCGGCGQVDMPVEHEPQVGPTPVVEDDPNAAPANEPSATSPDKSSDPSLPVDAIPHSDPVNEPAATPPSVLEPKGEPQIEPPTQPAETPENKAHDETTPALPQPMLDAPVPADVIPDPQPGPEKAVEPAVPEPAVPVPTPNPLDPPSPDVPNQDLPPAVPENVLPPSSTPAATPVSHQRDASRSKPERKVTRLSDYIRVR